MTGIQTSEVDENLQQSDWNYEGLSLVTMFRAVFWVVLPCKMTVDPEDSSEHHTRRRENLKSHKSGNHGNLITVVTGEPITCNNKSHT
jgi:hypothetical protein